MSVSSFVRRRVLKFLGGPVSLTSDIGWATAGEESGELSYAKRAAKSWAHICSSINATTAQNVPVRLYIVGGTGRFPTKRLSRRQQAYVQKRISDGGVTKQAGEVSEVTQHPAIARLERPWPPNIDGYTFGELTFGYLETCGNAFWIRDSDRLGGVTRLKYLPPWRVTVKGDSQDMIAGYVLDEHLRTRQEFAPDDVAHFKRSNQMSYLRGMGRVEPAVAPIDRTTAMNIYKRALYSNNCRPDFLFRLMPGYTMNAKQKKTFFAEWAAMHRGPGKAGRAGILDDGIEFKEISFSPREVALIQEAKFDRDETCSMFGVPISFVEMVGARAISETDKTRYMEQTIVPMLKRHERQLNLQYLPWFDPDAAARGKLFFMYDDPVPANVELRQKERTSLMSMGVPLNVLLQEDGYDEIDGGDVSLVPSNLQPLATINEKLQPTQFNSNDAGGAEPGRKAVNHDVARVVGEAAIERRFNRSVRQFFRRTVAGGQPSIPIDQGQEAET